MFLNILFLQHTVENCTGCFWCWALWMFLSLILGLTIGKWIWGKYKHLIHQKDAELSVINNKNIQIEKAFIDTKYQLVEIEKDNKGLKASLADAKRNIVALSTQLSRIRKEKEEQYIPKKTIKEEVTPLRIKREKEQKIEQISLNHSKSSKTINKNESTDMLSDYGAYLKNNNLKIVEGIGPKIENILNLAGIKTWKDLANTPHSKLQNIIHDAGPRYRIHDPKTWNQQAQLVINKKWIDLIILQKELYAKRTNNGFGLTSAKVEKLVAKKLGFETIDRTNLKIIEGIGSKIEDLLKINGIKEWKTLSTAPIEQLQGILEDAGDRYRLADPSTWSKQAGMALNANWIELKEYQSSLQSD